MVVITGRCNYDDDFFDICGLSRAVLVVRVTSNRSVKDYVKDHVLIIYGVFFVCF